MVYDTAMRFSSKQVANAANNLLEPLDGSASFGGAQALFLARSIRHGKNTCFCYISE
jgi:hypothetical protein